MLQEILCTDPEVQQRQQQWQLQGRIDKRHGLDQTPGTLSLVESPAMPAEALEADLDAVATDPRAHLQALSQALSMHGAPRLAASQQLPRPQDDVPSQAGTAHPPSQHAQAAVLACSAQQPPPPPSASQHPGPSHEGLRGVGPRATAGIHHETAHDTLAALTGAGQGLQLSLGLDTQLDSQPPCLPGLQPQALPSFQAALGQAHSQQQHAVGCSMHLSLQLSLGEASQLPGPVAVVPDSADGDPASLPPPPSLPASTANQDLHVPGPAVTPAAAYPPEQQAATAACAGALTLGGRCRRTVLSQTQHPGPRDPSDQPDTACDRQPLFQSSAAYATTESGLDEPGGCSARREAAGTATSDARHATNLTICDSQELAVPSAVHATASARHGPRHDGSMQGPASPEQDPLGSVVPETASPPQSLPAQGGGEPDAGRAQQHGTSSRCARPEAQPRQLPALLPGARPAAGAAGPDYRLHMAREPITKYGPSEQG